MMTNNTNFKTTLDKRHTSVLECISTSLNGRLWSKISVNKISKALQLRQDVIRQLLVDLVDNSQLDIAVDDSLNIVYSLVSHADPAQIARTDEDKPSLPRLIARKQYVSIDTDSESYRLARGKHSDTSLNANSKDDLSLSGDTFAIPKNDVVDNTNKPLVRYFNLISEIRKKNKGNYLSNNVSKRATPISNNQVWQLMESYSSTAKKTVHKSKDIPNEWMNPCKWILESPCINGDVELATLFMDHAISFYNDATGYNAYKPLVVSDNFLKHLDLNKPFTKQSLENEYKINDNSSSVNNLTFGKSSSNMNSTGRGDLTSGFEI